MEEGEKSAFKKFSKGYVFKILMLAALILLLLIPLAMIKGLIRERDGTARDAEKNVMEAWGSQLLEAGPVLAVPGIQTSEHITKTEREGEKREIIKKPFVLIIMPEKLNVQADFKTEIRKRGIFSVPLFSGDLTLNGTFNPEPALASLAANEELDLSQAELIISLSSQKGIRKINKAEWNAAELFFQPGNRNISLIKAEWNAYDNRNSGGIYAAVPRFTPAGSTFDINIAIQGGQLLRFLPIGQDTHAEISADWASPSFQGSFLPGASTVTDSGFEAYWDISYLSRDIPLFLKVYNDKEDAGAYSGSLFGVDFFRAIDTYSLNTRAVKYAILFLIVPFLTLFLLEIYTRKRIHPVPYLLSGIANVIFYLLLLSFSEQMQFHFAYLIASLAVTTAMTLYARSLLPSWSKSAYMALVVMLSYVLLYAVLNAESYALLIGSVGAFVVVTLVMFLTRKLDWYGQEDRDGTAD